MSAAPEQPGKRRAVLAMAITVLENISGIVIFLMMILTFVDVIGRYAFNSPIFGATEMISALLALAIFSGLGVINARDDHIVVELFEGPIRRLISPLVHEIIIQVFSIACMALIAFVLFEHAWETYHLQSLTVVLELPLFYVSATISLFATISVISQIAGVISKISKLRHSGGSEAQ